MIRDVTRQIDDSENTVILTVTSLIKMTETKNNRLVTQNFQLLSCFGTTTESIMMKFDLPAWGPKYSLSMFPLCLSIFDIGHLCILASFSYILYADVQYTIHFTNISINPGIISAALLLIGLVL